MMLFASKQILSNNGVTKYYFTMLRQLIINYNNIVLCNCVLLVIKCQRKIRKQRTYVQKQKNMLLCAYDNHGCKINVFYIRQDEFQSLSKYILWLECKQPVFEAYQIHCNQSAHRQHLNWFTLIQVTLNVINIIYNINNNDFNNHE